jgi:HSP20 family molecular chaperone IbpA
MNQTASNGPSASSEPANAGPTFMPPADIFEKGDMVVMLLDVPGADPASLDVMLDKHLLTISARVASPALEGYAPAHIEFGNGTYERRFVFSERMDGDRIDAILKDGVLRLSIPKAAHTAAKKISVKAE